MTAPVLADSLSDVRPVAAPSDPAAGGDAVGVFRPAAVIGRGELEGSGLQSPGDWQAPEPAPRRLPATVAVGRRPLSVRVRALSGLVRRAVVPLAGGAVLARAGRAWRAVAVPLLLLTTLAATPAHSQNSGICARTDAVETAILAKISGVSACALVTTSDLAAISGTLWLDARGITALAEEDFAGLEGVTSLVLSDNALARLPAGVFDGLTSLTTLWLDGNALTTLPDEVFDRLIFLDALHLYDNKLTSLRAGVFDELTSLTTLRLYDNKLTSLPDGVFDRLTFLGDLSLYGNKLTSLPDGVFDELTSLTRMWLHENALTALPAEVFDELTVLTEIILSRNALTSLRAGVFDKLTLLKKLSLVDNKLNTVPAGVFDQLTLLTELSLEGNQLTTLPAGVFDELTALTDVWLNRNALTTLPAGAFEPLASLKVLRLEDNPGAPFAPVAVALPDDGTIPVGGGKVTLDGSGSDGGPWGANVTYSWALTDPPSGVTVDFDDEASIMPEVTIPALPEGTPLTFTLTVTAFISGGGVAPGIDTAGVAPPALSVGDAWTLEPTVPGMTSPLLFEVVLRSAGTGTVTVDFATHSGTAAEGEDYVASNGTLTFEPGDTLKTVEVPVLADGYDEGSETMTLVLSNAREAAIVDAEGIGTIREIELTPKAWIARFGRTVAEQALEAIEGRMRATLEPGVEVALAGARIGGGSEVGSEADRAALREEEAQRGALRLADWLKGETDPEEAQRQSRAVTPRDLLTGSAFALTAETADKDLVSLWGRGAVTRFDGREGELTLDGEVVNGMLGADWSGARWTAGLIVSRSVGKGGYSDGSGSGSGGRVEAALTGLFPWARHALSERLEAWGAAGYGAGELTVTPKRPGADEDGAAVRADLDLRMAAAGLRGTMLDGGGDGLTLTGKTDAMFVQTTSERGRGADGGSLEPAQATVTRLRLGLEASRTIGFGGGAALTPSLEVGVRHDGGDAETGFGFDLGGGLALSNPERGLQAELRGRGLFAHESEGFRDLGFSGSLAWEEKPSSDRGTKLRLTQTVGNSSSGGADALLARGTLEGLAANDNGEGDVDDLGSHRLELKLGYGLSAFDDRFTWTPEAGFGLSDTGRDYGLGWRLVRGGAGSGPDDGSLELAFEARRRESVHEDTPPAHEVGLRITAQF